MRESLSIPDEGVFEHLMSDSLDTHSAHRSMITRIKRKSKCNQLDLKYIENISQYICSFLYVGYMIQVIDKVFLLSG